MVSSGSDFGFAATIVFTVLLLLAAVGDIRTRRISNRLVLVLTVLGLTYSIWATPVLPGVLRGTGGLITGFACWIPFYVLGWLGAGDIKLYAAAASWLGPLHALEGALIAAVSGAVLALIWMVWTSGAKNVASTLAIAAARPSMLAPGSNTVAIRKTLPYGVALAFGAIVAAWMPGLLF